MTAGQYTAATLDREARQAGLLVTAQGHMREADLATYLGSKRRAVRDWREKGTGPAAIRKNGKIWYELAAIAAWLNARCRPVTRTCPACGALLEGDVSKPALQMPPSSGEA